MVRRGWVGILIVGDENITSTLDARRDRRYFLGKLERLAMRTLCYSIPEADWIGLPRFPSTEAIDAGSRGLLLLLCVTRACPLKRELFCNASEPVESPSLMELIRFEVLTRLACKLQ